MIFQSNCLKKQALLLTISIKKLHRMCTEEKLSDNFKETIEELKEDFENVHQVFGLSETLKIQVILHHYSDYFVMTGKTFRETNGEHHEVLHHTLKTMERKKNQYMKKKSWWGCSPTEKPSVYINQEGVKCWIYTKSQAQNKKKQNKFRIIQKS